MKNKYLNTFLISVLFAGSAFVNAQTITTVGGNGTAWFGGDGGSAIAAQMWNPLGVATDATGNVYFADNINQRIRKINTSGTITTIAGNGTAGFGGDGGAATSAPINAPAGVATDVAGNVYIADWSNHRIRKVSTSGTITTIAGNGTQGYGGDGGPATSAQLYNPCGIAVDAAGDIYFSDNGNHRIRKISGSSGVITTIAGTGTAWFSGDGGLATSAQIWYPIGVAVDGNGNVFFADNVNQRIRKINTSGIITTVAGNGTAGFGGDGGPATSAPINSPYGIVVDGNGNLFIADNGNNRIRKVTANGVISTVAGTGTGAYSGDGGPPAAAQIFHPCGVALNSIGSFYFADQGNQRIRKIVGEISGIEKFSIENVMVAIFPNPTGDQLSIRNNSNNEIEKISIIDAAGKKVMETKNVSILNVQNLDKGLYNVLISVDGKNYSSKFIKE